MNQRDLSCSVIVLLSAVFMQTITCPVIYVYIWLNLKVFVWDMNLKMSIFVWSVDADQMLHLCASSYFI